MWSDPRGKVRAERESVTPWSPRSRAGRSGSLRTARVAGCGACGAQPRTHAGAAAAGDVPTVVPHAAPSDQEQAVAAKSSCRAQMTFDA